MAWLTIRGKYYYANWRENGRPVQKSTGIKTELTAATGKKSNAKQQRQKAELIATTLENAAKGRVEQQKALAAVSSFYTGLDKIPSIEEYSLEYVRRKGNRPNDKKAVNRFLQYLQDKSKEPLTSLTVADCRDYVHWLLTDPQECVRPATVKRDREVLNAIYNRAIDAEIVTRNPWKPVRIPKESPLDIPENKRRALTPEQIAALIDAMPDEWPDLIRLTVYTIGKRLGDIACLRWSQVDRANKIIHIRTGKTKKNLDQPITPAMQEILTRLEASRIDEYIFPASRVKYTRSGKLSLEFREYAVKLGFINPDEFPELPGKMKTISPLSFHSIRKTAVTMARQVHTPPDACRELVGHDSEEIQRAYFAPTSDYLSQEAEKIGNAILPPQAPDKTT